MSIPAIEDAGEKTSVFQSDLTLREKLDRARTELLDLSARNRLLNMPRSSKGTRSIEVVDERSVEIFRLLVREARPFTFVPGKAAVPTNAEELQLDDAEEIKELTQPEGGEVDERGVLARHTDTRLQTRLTSEGLQKRLLELYFDARTLEEEQGVNILFLTLGALKWIDPQNASNIRFAPLILVPVALERANAGEKFKLRVRQEDFASNMSLEAYLERVHSIRLPTFDASDSFDPAAYLKDVNDAVTAKTDWEVIADDIFLGFFSFAKFLMYRDLDPETWPRTGRLTDRELVRKLLAEGFSGGEVMIPEEANIDPFITPAEMLHILDCDSSQALAVHEVRRGRNMVIQGPPGTGKSQTIANIIASAVADGKTVLFVAEKMAALEVVKRRLDKTGVGDACLELHSNKANKRSILEELRRTWELGAPRGEDPGSLHARLTAARDRLNAHSVRMHARHRSSGLTPFQVVGQLTRLRLEGEKPSDINLDTPIAWSFDEFSHRHVITSQLVERIDALGRPDDHIWSGVGLSSILPPDVERLTNRIDKLAASLAEYNLGQTELAATLEAASPADFRSLSSLADLASRIAGAPPLDGSSLANSVWHEQARQIRELVAAGQRYARIHADLAPTMREEAWTADLVEIVTALDLLPSSFTLDALGRLQELSELLPLVVGEASALAQAMGREAPRNLSEVRRMAQIGERVASAPEASSEAFAAEIWDNEIERANDVALAVAELEASRAQIGECLTDAAWNMNLAQARITLASHGSSLFKILSSEWRSANRLVRSVLARPDTALQDTLALLDALARGQVAKRNIERDDAFARHAFASDWRGDRSASAPLVSLVGWMRSTRGLGAEPRLVVSSQPDKAAVRSRAARTASLAERISPLLARIWDDLGNLRQPTFGGAADGEHAELAALIPAMMRLHAADLASTALMTNVPEDLAERRTLLISLRAGQAVSGNVSEGDALGRSAYGDKWKGKASEWEALNSAADWIERNNDILGLASRIEDRSRPAGDAADLLEKRETLIRELNALFDNLRLDRSHSLGASDPETLTLVDLRRRLETWAISGEQLFQWVAYRSLADRATDLGCGDIVIRLADGRLKPASAVAAFEMAYYEAVYADQVQTEPELSTFDGALHGGLAREFSEMDRQRIASASFEVIRAHHKLVPPRDGGALGPLGVLRAEIARKRGHMPIRKLLDRAAPAVQALKPVFMMSPLSIAQFLVPGVFDFDLLVMDEASQIQPVDALGAVGRAKQVVVVGDPKQLPPTAFFAKMTTGASNDDDDDNGSRVADIESILGLFTARGLPTRLLRWHYRSKHQSLIAVSNRQFYENKLFIVPSPYTTEAGMGLRFHHVPQGIFDAGGTRTNIVEAKIVAQAIIVHAREHANLSLGVAAFSVAQRRAILDQLELLRRTLPPEVEAFFQSHPAEPFFVKNLENVQGDERDVIFISVGYGPTVAGGRPPMRFGPLGIEGGERRLNVLISRAKHRCDVFASMTDEDIEPEFAATRKGVFAFKFFMHFARTGHMVMAESTGRDHDSVFEEQVAKALQAHGYQVHRQVGLAGFFIDLAVADLERPGRYLLGIECDGASYHEARSARDRDRLRQSVLESHGWTIHRIWSTDWFQRPNQQLELVVSRIEAAKAEFDMAAAAAPAHRAVPVDIVTVEREDVTEVGLVAVSQLYTEAVVKRPDHLSCELHEAPTGMLAALVDNVVEVEGPVHVDEVVNRIRDAWGLKRAGGRIQVAVERAADVSLRMGRIVQDENFLSMPGRKPIVRDRSEVSSLTLRRPDTLPPAELELAILNVVRDNFGATDEQVCQAAARAIGFKSTSSQFRELIASVVKRAEKKGWLAFKNDMLVLGAHAPAFPDGSRKPLSPLLSLIAQGEHERLEFKETLRWDVKLGGPNMIMEDMIIKTIAGFANKLGGTLLIGVSDSGEPRGLERDFNCLRADRDRFELHLTNLLIKHFGKAYRALNVGVSFPEHEGITICRVDLNQSSQAVFITMADKNGGMAERFYVRSGNSTQELPPSETVRYIREHFPN